MEAQKSDRIGPSGGRSLFDLIYVVFAILLLAAGAVALFGWNLDTLKGEARALGVMKREDFSALYKRLGVKELDPRTEASSAVHEALAKLDREPCDPKAIYRLAQAAKTAGEERWASDALMGFSGHCGAGTDGEKREAASLLVSLHDFSRAFAIAKDLTDAHPNVGGYWYVRAKAEVGLGRVDDALLGYANTIHLEAQPHAVGSWVFYEMSDLYAAAHRYCEAIGPVQDYVALDPGARNGDKPQRLIETYAAQGHCTSYAGGSDSFPVSGGNVIHARVAINGVTGLFIVDTGASFVTVTAGFARKAHLEPKGTAARFMSANGAVYDRLASAGSIKVGRVEAKQVPVAIQEQSLGQMDGLLGRSFLSRFDVSISSSRWGLRSKAAVAKR